MFIECRFKIKTYDYSPDEPAETKEQHLEKSEDDEREVIRQPIFFQMLESCI